MKNTILILIGAMVMLCCNRRDALPENSQVKEEISRTEYRFFNEDKKWKAPKNEEGVVEFKLKDHSTLRRVAGAAYESAERIFTKTMERVKDEGFYKIRLPKGKEFKAVEELKANPDVEWAALNTAHETQGMPNDPYWLDGSLWDMLHIGMTEVWQSGNNGNKNVVVAVIDEGIFSHDELCRNLWNNPFELDNGIDDDGNGYIDDFHGWNWFDNNNQIYMGGDAHGTWCAGKIGAVSNNGIGIAGMNSNVTIISCKFLNGYGYDDNAVKAIDYLIDLKQRHGINIKVANNSWGGGGYHPGLVEAIERAKNADILMCFAAGNFSEDNDATPFYPASYPNENIIAVGASDWNNNRAAFSHIGKTTVDIFAPGTATVSTVPSSQHTSAYAFYSGTSMATPCVTGAAALYFAINTDATWQQCKQAILSNATPLPQLENLCVTGGLLNVRNFTGQTDEVQQPIYPCPEITPDQNPPTIPQNLVVYETGFDPTPGAFYGGYFGVRWDRSTDPEGSPVQYILWMNGEPQWILGGVNYVFAGLDTTVDIICQVQAQDAWGNQSNFSNSDTAIWNGTPTPPDTEAPILNGTPTTSNVTINSITFNHQAASDNVGVQDYTINFKPTSGTTWLQRTSNNLSETFGGLPENTTYEFYYTARDFIGNQSQPSVTIQATTLQSTPPPPITTVTLSGQVLNGTTHKLEWTTNATITSQVLQRKERGTWESIYTSNSPYSYIQPSNKKFSYRVIINNQYVSNTVILQSKK